MSKRPNWDEYFMQLAQLVATRSTCQLREVGAVLVKDKRVLATGYNGSAPGAPHCIDVGCTLDESGKCKNVLHAEQNVILQAAQYGISVSDTTIYCTYRPCAKCTLLIAGSGIKKIVYSKGEPEEESLQILKMAGVEIRALMEEKI